MIGELRGELLRMARLSEEILQKSLAAVRERDAAAAAQVLQDDLAIDRLDVEIDKKVLHLLATQAPVADDLRRVMAGKMVANDLERVGDLARNIAKCAMRLCSGASASAPERLRELGEQSQRQLRRAIESFERDDSDLARQVLRGDDQVDRDQDQVVRAAIEEIALHPEASSQGVDFVLIAKHLERVADHATNIAEYVILATEARNVKHADKLSPQAPEPGQTPEPGSAS